MKFRELEIVWLKLDIASPGVKPSIIGVAVDIQDDKKEVLVEFSDDEEKTLFM